jgi:diguanylate cyclase (GGDEF)-like protein
MDLAASDTGAGSARMLLAGAEAVEIAGELSRQAGPVEQAATILEAVLLAREPKLAEVAVVAAGVSQEVEQLEAAVRALRKVYPEAAIFLLCEPADEVRCRKALAWGATDYLILPLDGAGVAALAAAARSEVHGAPADAVRQVVEVRYSGAGAGAGAGAGWPLEAQTQLLFDLANGQPDIAGRAVALVQQQAGWNGKLRFVPADPGQTQMLPTEGGGQLRAAVTLPGAGLLGTLVLESEGAAGHLQGALEAAARFVGSVLAVVRRYEQLRSLAITDELSGAYNRRYFTKFVTNLLDRARENRFRVTLLLFDIDDFKKYNDRFGHASGDAIIRELIKLLRACTRPHDLVARVGGDEFAVVFWDNEAPRQPNSEHPRDAIAATERFRKAIQSHQWPATCNIQGDVSISGGLASFPWDADTLQELMARADEALLRAKAAGKNAILLHAGNCPPEM